LKVHLAANAALGFSANGTFALVLARETGAPVFRLRLYKLAKNGWNFAFNASAGEQMTLPTVFQKGNANDLISAVFGVHVAQLVQDLQTPINPAMISKFIETRGMNEFTDLTGVNPDQILAAGKAKVDQFVNDWNALTNKPATMLAKILSQNKDISDLTTFLKDIQGADQSTVWVKVAIDAWAVRTWRGPSISMRRRYSRLYRTSTNSGRNCPSRCRSASSFSPEWIAQWAAMKG
jgi:hypothetical protein